MPLLETKDLTISFKTGKEIVKVVHEVSFTLNKGESVAIVGESGCGKSALAKAITSLHNRQQVLMQGSISFEGEELVGISEKKLQNIRGKKIGYIFQDPLNSLNPALTIGSQLKEVSSESKALELLEMVGIRNAEERLHFYPHMLSGGQRQRIMIAMALASNPNLIIADEPTTALDVTVQAQILTLIADIKKKTHTSFVLITHDLKIVASVCERILVMYAGKIVEEGSIEEIFYHPKHPYTQKLLQAIPRMDKPREHKLIALSGSPPSFSHMPKGCPFVPRCDKAMPICKNTFPPRTVLRENHSCSCWLYNKGSESK